MVKGRIVVMAGTPVDTGFGCALVEREGWEAIPVAISKNPQEQTVFQSLSTEQKEEEILSRLQKMHGVSFSRVLVYCNSLSASVDFSKVSEKTGLPIRTPFDFYHEIAPRYQRLGVIAANAQGAAGVERELVSANPSLSLFSVANIAWVEAIERREAPKSIVCQYGLPETMQIFEQNGCEAVVLGCTHFPRLEEALQRGTLLPIENGDHSIRAWLSASDS